jgi:hypothetical protein
MKKFNPPVGATPAPADAYILEDQDTRKGTWYRFPSALAAEKNLVTMVDAVAVELFSVTTPLATDTEDNPSACDAHSSASRAEPWKSSVCQYTFPRSWATIEP